VFLPRIPRAFSSSSASINRPPSFSIANLLKVLGGDKGENLTVTVSPLLFNLGEMKKSRRATQPAVHDDALTEEGGLEKEKVAR